MNKKSVALVWFIMMPHIGLGMGVTGISVNTLNYAINKGDPKLVEKILSDHADLINHCDKDGNMPLHVVVEAYNAAHIDYEPVHSDDEAGDLERRSDSKRGKQEEILRALLDAGAKPNARDRNGDTPLDRLTKGAPLMLSVGTTNFRAVTSAHLLFYDRGGKTSEELKKERKAQLTEVRRQSGKRKRGK